MLEKNITDGFIKTRKAKIYYQITGEGTPLIMLHGNMQDSSFFASQTEFFKDHFQVIILDSRGHGKSTLGTDSLSINLMAGDVIAFLRHFKIDKCIILGFSDGGNIALKLATRIAGKIEALVVVSANLYPEALKPLFLFVAQLAVLVTKILSFIPPISAMHQKLALMTDPLNINIKKLKSVDIPALLLAGENDIIEERHTREIAGILKKSELKIISGAGHFLLETNAGEVNEMILEFLEAHKI